MPAAKRPAILLDELLDTIKNKSTKQPIVERIETNLAAAKPMPRTCIEKAEM